MYERSHRSLAAERLILLPHEGGEEAGMEECVRLHQTVIDEVSVKLLPAIHSG